MQDNSCRAKYAVRNIREDADTTTSVGMQRVRVSILKDEEYCARPRILGSDHSPSKSCYSR